MSANYRLRIKNYGLKLYNTFCKTRPSELNTHSSLAKYFIPSTIVLASICSLSGGGAQAQNNVGIGTTTPNSKAILELNANDKGFLAPRMNTVQMNAIAVTSAENALLIYNTDSACYHFYNGLAWKNLCQKGIDTAVINKAIKNYLGGVSFTTVINNMLVDSSVTNYAVINNAIVNNITIDSSVINYTTINNAVINNLTVDSSFTNVSNSNISNINIANIDTSITSVATINNATINNLTSDSTISNYSNINNAVIDSSITNYSQVSHLQGGWGSMDSLQIGGQNIMTTLSDSIKSQAWLLKGNTGTNASTNFLGTTDNISLRIRTNNTERMIVDSIGSVGIGVSNPKTELHVIGNLTTSNSLQNLNLSLTPDFLGSSYIQAYQSTGVFTPLTIDGAGITMRGQGATNILLNAGMAGNVGIGTVVPTAKLDILGTFKLTDGSEGLGKILVSDALGLSSWQSGSTLGGSLNSAAWTLFGNSGTNSATNFIGTTDAQDFVFKTNNTENMRIINGGNVGIGSITPAQKLSVEGGNIQVGELIPATGVGRNLIFSDAFNNSDAIHFVRENTGVNLSKLTLVLGDDYLSGATVNDQFNIQATNNVTPVLSVNTGNASVGIGTSSPIYKLEVLDGFSASTNSDGLASAMLSQDGCIELFRNRASFPNGKAYIDFKDNASDDLDFRIEQYNPLGNVANQVLNYYSPLSPRTLSMRNDNGYIGMGLNFDLHSAETRLHLVEDNITPGLANDLLLLDHYHNNGDWTPILQRTARGTEAAPADLQTNDGLGGLLLIGRAGGTTHNMSFVSSNYAGNGSNNSSNLFFGTSGTNRVMIDQIGNVGVGTMGPAEKLTIESGNIQLGEAMPATGVGRKLIFSNDFNMSDAIYFQRENIVSDASNLNLYIGDNQGSGSAVSDKFNVMTTGNPTPIFTVDAGTYSVGIGNVTPQATLDLTGPVKYAFASGTGAGSDGPSRAIIPAGDGGTRMNDWPSTWGGGLSTWDIVGSSTFFGAYNTRSDIRLKKDIVTMNTDITTSFMQLRPVTYLLKKETPELNGTQYGFIAQEVAKLFPSIVTKDSGVEGATIGMNYQALIAPTVHVVQEQQKTITTLQTQLQELARKLDEQNKLLQLLMQEHK